MNRWLFIIFVCFVFFLVTDNSFAAPILYRVQMMKAHRQGQPTQEEVAQHQQQEQQGNQDQGQPGAPAAPTYQQTVDQRNQAIAQAILDAHNQSVSSENVPFGNNADVSQAQQPTTYSGPAQQQQVLPQANSKQVKDVVDLAEVWKKLDTKSTVWTLLIDDQAKLLTVSEYIGRFQQEGVKINNPPVHYVQMIDQISQSNPQMLQRPFGELLQILAIVDYDFDNGMDKDELARKVLGEAGYEANKKRFSQPQQQQQ